MLLLLIMKRLSRVQAAMRWATAILNLKPYHSITKAK